ncbi:hypothetical protein N9M84_02805 [Candidatus Poseidoniales archaeon]|nr:hypothetical protein [Candidatus Poseidoniales archaeon]
MAKVSQLISQVGFDSNEYHVLLYGINKVDAKLEEGLLKGNGKFDVGGFCLGLRSIEGIKEVDIAKFTGKNTLELSTMTRYIDKNTINNCFGLYTIHPHYWPGYSIPYEIGPHMALKQFNAYIHLLRIRGLKFLTPLITSTPFSECFENDYKFSLYEDVGMNDLDLENREFSISDVEWAENQFEWWWNEVFDNEVGNALFALPLQMLYSSIFSSGDRSKLASIWIGIEALIKPPEDAIGATVISSLVKFGGLSKSKAVDFWYDSIGRCKVVHGVVSSSQNDQKLSQRTNEVREVFCKMLRYFIEKETLPKEETIQNLLNSNPSTRASS